MRIEQVVSQLCQCNSSFRDKIEYLSQATGGWERWFQLELAYYIRENFSSNYIIKLENNAVYPNEPYRADLTLTNRAVHQMQTIVELKCQVTGTPAAEFARLIEQDIRKALSAARDWDYEVIAITQGPNDMQYILNKLSPRHPRQISGRPFINLRSPGAFIHFFQGAGPAIQIDDDDQ